MTMKYEKNIYIMNNIKVNIKIWRYDLGQLCSKVDSMHLSVYPAYGILITSCILSSPEGEHLPTPYLSHIYQTSSESSYHFIPPQHSPIHYLILQAYIIDKVRRVSKRSLASYTTSTISWPMTLKEFAMVRQKKVASRHKWWRKRFFK